MTGLDGAARLDAAQVPRCEVCDTHVTIWRIGPHCALWRCPGCGHVARDLRLCEARARTHAWGGDRDLDSMRLALTYRRIRRAVRGTVPRSVFEIGFGSGELLARFVAAGCEVAGVDARDLEMATHPRLQGAGQLFSGEIESLPPTMRSYDLVYGVHVLEHLRDTAVALRRCREMLVPGGHVYFLTPTTDSAGPRLFRDSWWLLEDPTHVRFFSAQSVRLALQHAGFADIETRLVLLDNLSMEVCSTIRLIRRERSEHGVLSSRSTRVMSMLGAPAAVVGRLAWPRLRPTLEVIARV